MDVLFDRLKARFLGPKTTVKADVAFNRYISLPGLYEAAHLDERGIPDLEHLDRLIAIASNYLDAVRFRTKAHVASAIRARFQEARTAEEIRSLVSRDVAAILESATIEVRRIVDAESQNVRNIGVLDGIVRANITAGVEDPAVYFVVVRDDDTCEECKRLHLLDDEKTPRVWRLSELEHGKHKRGEASPKVGGLHPHCRCSLTTLLPGYGFDRNGRVVWKKQGHAELERQRTRQG